MNCLAIYGLDYPAVHAPSWWDSEVALGVFDVVVDKAVSRMSSSA